MILDWLKPKPSDERDLLTGRITRLETDLEKARAEVELMRAQRDRLLDARDATEAVETLEARIAELETKNAGLRHAVATSGGGSEELLRERATNARLAEDVHRLTMASIKADKGWK